MTDLSSIFDAIADVGYWVGDELVPMELAQSLNKVAYESYQSGHFTPAQIGKGESKQRDESIRSDSILWIDDWHSHKSLQEYFNILQNLQTELNRTFFLGLKRFEGHLAIYHSGAHYAKHLDVHKGPRHRAITFITYLNRGEGGELVIYDKAGLRIEKIISPQMGRTVIFKSSEIYHEVRPAFFERLSITGWFRTDL